MKHGAFLQLLIWLVKWLHYVSNRQKQIISGQLMFTYPYHFALKIKSLIYDSFVLVFFFLSFFFLFFFFLVMMSKASIPRYFRLKQDKPTMKTSEHTGRSNMGNRGGRPPDGPPKWPQSLPIPRSRALGWLWSLKRTSVYLPSPWSLGGQKEASACPLPPLYFGP